MTTKRLLTHGACALSLWLARCASFEPEVGPEQQPAAEQSVDGGAEAGGPAGPVSFKRDIRPLMDRTLNDPAGQGCHDCHYSTNDGQRGIQLGHLDLTTLGTLRKGGLTSAGTIVIPGKPLESAIVQKLLGTYPVGARMPRTAKRYWNADEMKLIEDWITQGAAGDDSE